MPVGIVFWRQRDFTLREHFARPRKNSVIGARSEVRDRLPEIIAQTRETAEDALALLAA